MGAKELTRAGYQKAWLVGARELSVALYHQGWHVGAEELPGAEPRPFLVYKRIKRIVDVPNEVLYPKG